MRPPPPATELLQPARRERVDKVVDGRTRSLTVVLEEIHDPHNIGAVLRTCECFGVQEVHVVEGPRARYKPGVLVTQGAEKWVDVKRSRDIRAVIASLKASGHTVLASSLSGASKRLPELPAHGKLALIFGNESDGVSEAALAGADGTFVIPMYGFTQSLNVSVAVGVSVSWLVLSRAAKGGSPGDLAEAERNELRERFYVKAVKQRGRLYFGKKAPPPPRRYQSEENS